jgi:hypothetical protein
MTNFLQLEATQETSLTIEGSTFTNLGFTDVLDRVSLPAVV